MNPLIRTVLMTKQIINGFLQKPIHLTDLYPEVNNQLHTYDLQKQKSLIQIK
jgi:hypothetical protein